MCGQSECHGRHGQGRERDVTCGCGPRAGCGSHSWRRFATREERVAALEGYLSDLKAEAQAVEERLAELKAAK